MNIEESKDIIIDNLTELRKKRGRPRKEIKPEDLIPKLKKQSLYLNDQKEYFKQYYANKILKPCECSTCGTKFASTYSLTRHNNNNKNCKIIKLEKLIYTSESSETSENNNKISS